MASGVAIVIFKIKGIDKKNSFYVRYTTELIVL